MYLSRSLHFWAFFGFLEFSLVRSVMTWGETAYSFFSSWILKELYDCYISDLLIG